MVDRSGLRLSGAQQSASFQSDGFAEGFLAVLGATQVESIDNSAYERATHVADMNLPIPSTLKSRYSAVLDSGSTEHVFNYPQAIRNCMEMVEVGGHYLGIVPANNLCGHGFYQFSPELIFRVFSEENGFAVERVYIADQIPGANWLRCPDPATLGRRVEFSTRQPAYVYVRARRVAARPIFESFPQQSDYVRYWGDNEGDDKRRSVNRLQRLAGGLPLPVKRALATAAGLFRARTKDLRRVNLFAD